MTIEESFGIVLKRLRRESNLSQEKLSKSSCLDRAFISNIEGGKQQPSLISIFALASALNVTPSSIILETELILKINHPDSFKSERNKWEFDWVKSMHNIITENSDSYMGTETILVVDDEKLLRDMISSFLVDYGYNVILAADGQDALDKYNQNHDKIHLTIMDVVMPLKDGISAYKEIKDKHPNSLILLMSGYIGDNLSKPEGLPIIQKPFSPIEVIKLIRNALDGKQQYCAMGNE